MEPKDEKRLTPNNILKPGNPVGIEITFCTDPLCCWTWAMQPQWKRLLAEFPGSGLVVHYKMGGLLPSWKHFNDSINSIQKPIQMGPEWMHARTLSGAGINDRIWITDPPASSYPACIAFKCAEFQSPELATAFFGYLQDAVMVKSLNISRNDILLQVAAAFQMDHAGFDLARFRTDLFGEPGKEAFKKDLTECKYLNIGRLPTLLLRSANKKSILLSGYQTYESLRNAVVAL